MSFHIRPFLLALVALTLGVFASSFHPYAEETEDNPPSNVSEADLETYIAVYNAMQDDHGLSIEEAIKPYKLSLDEFRSSERRIQNESRLVERVRGALLDHAKKKAMFAQGPRPSPSPPTLLSATPTAVKKKAGASK